MAKISTDAEINSIRLKEQASAPDTPASGYFQVYVKTDGKLYYKDDAGTEVCLSDKMENPMTTAGDIIYGGASGAPTRLAAGTEAQVLTMGATNPEWAEASGGGGVVDIGAKVYHNTSQAIPPNTLTAVQFNSEVYDTDDIHDTSTNNTRLTCKTAGKYIVTGSVQFQGSATAGRRTLRFLKNGTTNLSNSTDYAGADAGYNPNLCISTLVNLEVNDYIELVVYQTTGGNLNVEYYSEMSPIFAMQKVA